VPPAPGETEPRHRALLYRLIARTRTGEIALAFDGEAPYREAGRYGDDDDRAPRTFTHLGADHTYWLARAIEDAWTAWRYASG
jgi:hypothetical protein